MVLESDTDNLSKRKRRMVEENDMENWYTNGIVVGENNVDNE